MRLATSIRVSIRIHDWTSFATRCWRRHSDTWSTVLVRLTMESCQKLLSGIEVVRALELINRFSKTRWKVSLELTAEILIFLFSTASTVCYGSRGLPSADYFRSVHSKQPLKTIRQRRQGSSRRWPECTSWYGSYRFRCHPQQVRL